MAPLAALRASRVRYSSPWSESDNDRGAAMAFAVLFMLMLGGVAVLLLGVIMGQVAPSLSAQQTTRASYSAQSGLQIGVGAIRAALDEPDAAGVVYGDPSALPCTVEGSADGEAGQLPFAVALRYYILDPANRDDDWLDDNEITCVEGGGVSVQPRYALVVSAGSSLNEENETYNRDRTMAAIYEFKVTNINIAGGRILNGARTHCLRAISAANDSRMAFYPIAQCTQDELELWIYDRDWKLKLASTTLPTSSPLCITGPANAPLNSTQDARLRACTGVSDPARWSQLWSWVGGENWRGQKENISGGISTFCLTPPTTGTITGQFLIARSNGCGSSMSPTPEVGAGAAGYSTQQIVNFRQFGRCADVTNESITHAFMIVYPCKQDPTGTGDGILWNHKWAYSEPAELEGSLSGQEVSVLNLNRTAERRCMTTQPNTSSNKYVVFQACTGDSRQKWTRVAQSASYEDSWLFVDVYGRCLSAATTDLFNSQFAKMVTVACDGTTEQKWNAPPNSTTSTFGGYREIAN